MSKDNIKGFRVVYPGEDNSLTSPKVEVVPKDGTTVDQAVVDFCQQWGVSDRSEIGEAEKWDLAVRDLSAGHITREEFERGQNSHRNNEFQHPKGRGK